MDAESCQVSRPAMPCEGLWPAAAWAAGGHTCYLGGKVQRLCSGPGSWMMGTLAAGLGTKASRLPFGLCSSIIGRGILFSTCGMSQVPARTGLTLPPRLPAGDASPPPGEAPRRCGELLPSMPHSRGSLLTCSQHLWTSSPGSMVLDANLPDWNRGTSLSGAVTGS